MKCLLSSKAHSRAFTFVEMAVALGVGGLAFAAIATMLFNGAKCSAIVGNYADLNRLNVNTLDRMSTDVRQANKVLSCTTNQLQIQAVDINTGATNTLTYSYDSTAKTLSRIYLGSTNIMLTGIAPNSFQFIMYQRNPIGGSLSNYVTTNVTVCKVVQAGWKCSRSIIGIGQTESAQSCSVVIRKE